MSKRTNLRDLINAGIIDLPFHIHVCFKGNNFSAEIDKDGFVILEGRRYTSLSVAGGIVRAMISGKPADGMAYRRVNGWSFWEFRDTKGQYQKMYVLRERYEKARGV
ncbi:hypothetical protein CN884_19320 [Ochrobactrum sp. 30A/1000/2015]|uniref:hypothetical protein n=1 Tax=Brucella intermedia TaxID=94625 RepID=UPI000C292530|nr:hypothetical protein [Brucella intermedia]MCO7727384.1 hypothetical protein [Brucella intermedia]PJT19903.1 hypothetical protein CN884_19320 [Ochrobactrum sp. 30A/1000/2015]PJT37006.1 hypothetical protein CN883_20095 [Ochrobactrum sp. 27A/999/2015]PJT45281.1 hypothetical protein CN882_05645 [Ochrobactrum sp. 23A/997/2015]